MTLCSLVELVGNSTTINILNLAAMPYKYFFLETEIFKAFVYTIQTLSGWNTFLLEPSYFIWILLVEQLIRTKNELNYNICSKMSCLMFVSTKL